MFDYGCDRKDNYFEGEQISGTKVEAEAKV